jgi:tetratricopeptide (TPR) repeat protein
VPFEVTAAVTNCSNINPIHTYELPEGSQGKQALFVVYESTGSQNCPILVYLRTNEGCLNVLYTEGSGIRFQKSKKKVFPDIEVYWHYSADDTPTLGSYTWDGNKYVDVETAKSQELYLQALKLFRKGDIRGAIEFWERSIKLAIIPGLGLTSNSEALNNLGYAYYKLAEKTKSKEHLELALTYLEQTTEVSPERWIAYLNLGDLYIVLDRPNEALHSYQELLKLNPNYKYASKIRKKIKSLKTIVDTI